ncbi:MAG TPA: FliH/SctL family protein [Steroidobacteraceae bacterium]|nr:FliH/SctL family protein [Steroidobacteraceae bacterium]
MRPALSQHAALTSGELEVLRDQAQAAGFEQGRQLGLEAGRRELAEATARLAGVLGALARPLEELDEEVEQELLALAFAIARQLVRREIKTDPAQVVGVVRDALSALPVAARDVKVYLHPEDAKLVRQHLPAEDQPRAWTIVEDAVLMRGGARVVTASSQVDARLETRLGALVAELLGSDRETNRTGPDGGGSPA